MTVSDKSGIPLIVEGHWETSEGRNLADEYAAVDRSALTFGRLSDFVLANRVFMASRTDLDLIHYQTAAKERIRWLSVQLALATSQRDKLMAVCQSLVNRYPATASGGVGLAEIVTAAAHALYKIDDAEAKS